MQVHYPAIAVAVFFFLGVRSTPLRASPPESEANRAVPYIDPATGKMRGYIAPSTKAGDDFAQLGIRQGDILTEVNGAPMNDPKSGLEAFQKLRGEPKPTVRVLRDGRTELLNESKSPNR